MKKLIAISVVFALVLGAAFAQPSIGGGLSVGTKILKGQTQHELDQKVVEAGGFSWDDRLINIGFGDDNAGGKIRIKSVGDEDQHWLAWWKPIPQLKIMLGGWDGEWGHQDIGGWGFDAAAKNPGVSMNMYWEIPALTNVCHNNGAWAPGINNALFISLYPIDALEVNIGIPVRDYEGAWQNVYGNTYLDIKFNLDGIGRVMLAAQFHPAKHDRYVASDAIAYGSTAPEYHWRKATAEAHNPIQAWLGFNLSAIENLGFELGLGFTLPYTTQDAKFVDDNRIPAGATNTQKKINVGGVGYKVNDDLTVPINTKVIAPVNVGLGASYAISDEFNVKARAGFKFGGKQKHDVSASDKYNQVYYDNNAASRANSAAVSAWLTGGMVGPMPTYTSLDTGHLDAGTAYYLNSDVYYEKRTTKIATSSAFYADGVTRPAGTTPDVLVTGGLLDTTQDLVEWTSINGTQEVKKDPVQWGLNVQPSYKVGDITVFLNLGIGMKHYRKQEVRIQKQELVTDTLRSSSSYGQTTYVNVYTETSLSNPANMTDDQINNRKFNGSYYDAGSKPVYETKTFEGKPGLFTKETVINYPTTQAELNDLNGKLGEEVKFDVDWFINPYISLPVGGGGTFFAGVKVFTNGDRKPLKYDYNATNALYGQAGKPYANASSTKYKVKWEIPIGFNFGF